MKSVGDSSTPEISVNSVNSVGGLAEGGVGMAGMPYPPKCVLCVPCIPWENTHPLGGKHKEGMAECHALLC